MKTNSLRIKVAKIFFEELKDYYRRHKSMPMGCLINGVNIAMKSYKDFYFDESSLVIRVKSLFTNDDYGLVIIDYKRFKSILFF